MEADLIMIFSPKTPMFVSNILPSLKFILYIHYLIQFKKNNKVKILTLIDSASEINAVTSAYATKLGLKIWFTHVKAQKIDSFLYKTYNMVLAGF